ncbi:3-deoxy-manno-octulosonate cytidylyltransferase [Phenylobacterium sp.]|jgi:3-deoxy-manno-octulosonate cytidylyltransferase (CMP-KDO synthetase)|uniref:3-deoxy-manno-octulosonate cytidylyltransferase n=1 Tax=Phenylobacterium sp. TaxID=1871053 RepID=UPI002E31E95D|nr:3-deoxy-manno-octulosonate cytidylyltransferase [Phenylobacterium sp.]HEX4711719.1 3-deoxy-manno-octulosonate cytidylyltransferase [Phenylobacterium sp.]
MNPIVLIPARMAATRLPGKPLADICGVPMIVRVLRQAQAAGVGPVAVAAGDSEIVAAVEAAGGSAVLTDPDLPSGSDRIVAALAEFDPQGRHDVVINLQGDIPFVRPEAVRAVARLLTHQPACDISTVMVAEAEPAERSNPDIPKVVAAMQPDGRSARALYFTRSVLYGDAPVWLHHGIYGFRREALERFTAAPPSPLERRERLEQLRALELGMSIWAAVIDEAPISVDNPADLERARAYALLPRHKEPS